MTNNEIVVERISIKVNSARINGRGGEERYDRVAKNSIEENKSDLCSGDLIAFLKNFENDHLLVRVVIESGILNEIEVLELLTKLNLSFSLCEIAVEKYGNFEVFITKLVITLYKKSSSSAKKILRLIVPTLSEDAKLDIAAAVNGDPQMHSILSIS